MGISISGFLSHYQTQVWSLVLVIFGAVVARIFRSRPKLLYSVHHSANLLVDQPLVDDNGVQISDRQLVRTASITIQNAGLSAAKGVEVAFNWKPPILNVNPARSFSNVDSPFNRYSLKFDSFAPGEQSTIEIMSINAELPIMTAVRCDDGIAKLIQMTPQRVLPTWGITTIWLIMALGAATCVYLVLSLLELAVG